MVAMNGIYFVDRDGRAVFVPVIRGGKGGGSAPAPAPPDPVATAQAQAAANKEAVRESAIVNQVNQVTPFGNMTWSGDIGSPNRTVTQTLAPDQQAQLDLTNQAGIKYGQTANTQLDAVRGKLSQPVDFSALGTAPTVNDEYRSDVENALFSRINPQLDRDRDALITRLANQGITDTGSQAYMSAIDELNRKENDLRLGITATGGQEAARQYGLEAAGRDRAINELMQERQVPLNELAAMLTGTQVQNPNFVNPQQYNVAPADVMGATYANYQGQQNQYAADQQRAAANRQGLYSLLGSGATAAALMWSDRRLKSDIVYLADLPNGLPLYRYSYAWGGDHVGVMADDVREKFPDAVRDVGGFDMIDYSMLEAA